MMMISMTKSAVFLYEKNIALSLAGWSVFICAAAFYCILFNQLVLLSPESYLNSLLWSLKHYAGWLVLTPLLLIVLAKSKQRRLQRSVWSVSCSAAALLLALSIRVIFELQSGAESRWVSALVNELPEQALVLTVVLLFWALQQQLSSGRTKSAIQAATPIQLPETSPVPSAEETVLVSKGQNECLIRWRAVDFISTAGNYVELFCDNETYLLRATMKQVEQRLPTADFVRIHRCHIVNISVIKRIETLPAGNGSVSLHGGQVLPISKGYKQLLRLHKFVAA
ncbi:hypothetical protein A5320_10730 [Rheinheimera sp. SA_1]|nr:hypothetical protein A5320_10730 [Rheinheimera sp. SA_1]